MTNLLNASEIITINKKIDVARIGEKNFYYSRIQDISDRYFSIQIPYNQKIPLKLVQLEKVLVKVFGKDAYYQFTTEVLGEKEDVIPVYLLALPKEIERVQLRQHVRLPAALDVYYQELAVGGESEFNPALERRKALTVDLSGGGVQLLTEAYLTVGTRLQLEVMVPYRERLLGITAIGRVKRCMLLNGTDKWSYQAGIAFERISEADRSKIISFIYRKMVEDRYRN